MEGLSNNTPNNKREPNIEILKVISMFMIVVWHFYVHGLDVNNMEINTSYVNILNFGISQLVIVICSTCVNLFVLITGFFLIGRGFKCIRFLKIWFQTVFYSLIIDTIVYYTNLDHNIGSNIWRDLMPIYNNTYWFVRQYLKLIVIAPFLSLFLSRLSKTAHHIIMISIVGIICFITIRYPFGGARYLSGGSFPWFIILFYTGGYLKLYNPPYARIKRLSIFWILVFITWVLSIFIIIYCHHFQNESLHNSSYEYNSFPYFLSVVLFSIIKNSNLKNKKVIHDLTYIASLTFGVYLIHDNEHIRPLIWEYIYSWDKLFNSILLTPIAILFSSIVFAVCISIDYIRKELFKVLKIDLHLYNFSNFIDRIIIKIGNNISKTFH